MPRQAKPLSDRESAPRCWPEFKATLDTLPDSIDLRDWVYHPGLLPVLPTNLEVLLAERRLERLLAEARAQARTDRAPVDAAGGLGYAGADKPGAMAATHGPGTE